MQNTGAFPAHVTSLYKFSAVHLPSHSTHFSRRAWATQPQAAQGASDGPSRAELRARPRGRTRPSESSWDPGPES